MKTIIFTITFIVLLFYSTGTIAQTTPIRGTVRSEGGPLRGVTVTVKSTNAATQSDAKGNFTISASPGDTLVLSYTGYASQDIAVKNQRELDVSLTPDVRSIDNVVVI